MTITKDQWTPLFNSLKAKLTATSRRILLSQMIGEIEFITKKNFGNDPDDRPEPWPMLSKRYAKRIGRTDPTLILSIYERLLLKKGLDKPHLINQFRKTVGDNSASLTNDSIYADNHQLGKTIPKRPYYPVQGDSLTPFAEENIRRIVKEHFGV